LLTCPLLLSVWLPLVGFILEFRGTDLEDRRNKESR